jgi:hypothetical protein
MTSFLRALMPAPSVPVSRGTTPFALSIDDVASVMRNGGYYLHQTMPSSDREEIEGNFRGLVQGAYASNGVVFACILTRLMLFSEARFQFQQMRGGQPGDLFGTQELAMVERPEPGKTTGDLLARAITDIDLAGNWFGARRVGRDSRGRPDGTRIKRLRPDWMTIVLGSPNDGVDRPADDPDAEVVGYIFRPGGYGSGAAPVIFARDEVAHFAPIPDPLAGYRGMSWLTPVIRETMADSAATLHKLKFFENAATPNMVVKFDPATTTEDAREAIEVFEQEHSGVFNAYRTAYLLGGADATVVGANLHEMDFKSTQGAGETRICAAAGVHPTVVGVSEGLQGSSLNAGNFDTAARLTANKTLRPNWRNFAGSLEVIVPPPNGSRLWYDDRDVPFLTENIKDRAEVLAQNASSIRTLSDAGAEWDPVIDAVVSGDLRRLRGAHSGLFSVQLLPPNETGSEADDDAAVARQPAAREVREMVALSEFWAASGFAEGTHVSPGQRFSSDDPVVRAFDQFFEPTSPASAAVRCHGCHSLLAELATAPYRFTCPKCKAAVAA